MLHHRGRKDDAMNLASRIPAKARSVAYVLLAVASAVQATWAPLPADEWGRLVSFAALLGFTIARGNVTPDE